MAKNPSSTWFFNDWENDPALKACSLAAQGLWKRLLCIAARAPEHGIVQIEGLTSGLPDGLPHLAAVVGRPPEEIAPLIDELLSSGTASRDRKGRLYCRRMVRAAGLSAKRSKVGRLGADVTNGKHERKEDLPQQKHRQTRAPSFFIPPDPLLISPTSESAERAAADPGGPPRARLPDSAKWAERLAGYRPWEGKRTWQPFWGPRPDSLQRNAALEHDAPQLLKAWLEEYRAAKARGECS
jgi:hypothetical protein